MVDKRIIRNYSASLFSNIESDNVHDLVLEQISMIRDVMINSDSLRFVFCAPIVSKLQKLELIKEVAKQTKLEKIVIQFCRILVKNSRFNILSEIVLDYKKLLMEARGIKSVKISSTNIPNKKIIDNLKRYLEEILEKKVELKMFEDKSLIGGFLMSYDSSLYDLSIAGAIARVEKIAKNTQGEFRK